MDLFILKTIKLILISQKKTSDNYTLQRKAAVWTGLSQCLIIFSSTFVTVIEPPAISNEVVKFPTKDLTTLTFFCQVLQGLLGW